jgi:hypothetical protein
MKRKVSQYQTLLSYFLWRKMGGRWWWKLTPWNKVLLQKLTIVQLVKEYRAFYTTSSSSLGVKTSYIESLSLLNDISPFTTVLDADCQITFIQHNCWIQRSKEPVTGMCPKSEEAAPRHTLPTCLFKIHFNITFPHISYNSAFQILFPQNSVCTFCALLKTHTHTHTHVHKADTPSYSA